MENNDRALLFSFGTLICSILGMIYIVVYEQLVPSYEQVMSNVLHMGVPMVKFVLVLSIVSTIWFGIVKPFRNRKHGNGE